MAYFLLAWNPSRYSDADFDTLAKQLQQGKSAKFRWSVTRSKKPTIGDRFFIIKLGNKGRGIFGSGLINSEPQEDLHYDPEEATKGTTLLYVEIEFDKLVDGYKDTLIDFDELNKIDDLTGIPQTWSPHGSGILINEMAAELLERKWREKTVALEIVEEKDYMVIADELDELVKVLRRKEQSFLRRSLFGLNKFAGCSICGKIFPVQFLICAHIKKRSECNDSEKRDIKNIVTPMCRFGCDELYERGCIAVHKGYVVDVSIGFLMDEIESYMKIIVGRECSTYHEGTKNEYFEWHHLKHCPNITLYRTSDKD